MKFKSLEVRNFRGIRDVVVHFSIDASHPLTVIEAGSGDGKTTFLLALRWALFGELATTGGSAASGLVLPKAPGSWDVEKQGTDIPVEVELWLSTQTGGVATDYQVVRKQTVRVSEVDRIGQDQEEVIEVYEKTSDGMERLENPEEVIRTRFITPSLMDVFLSLDFQYYFYTPAAQVGLLEKAVGLLSQRGGVPSDSILEDLSRLLNKHWHSILRQSADDQNDSRQVIPELVITGDFRIGAKLASGEITPVDWLTAAPRDALAISLLLALTHYSGLDLPVVLDAPFGAASQNLKRSAFRELASEQSQVVLLLHEVDIQSLGDQLTSNAGKHFQLCFDTEGIVANEVEMSQQSER